jgi:lysophospholipase L1-like esterase
MGVAPERKSGATLFLLFSQGTKPVLWAVYTWGMTSGGIVAVGDSITNACSKDLSVGGVPSRSWAEWVAAALGESLTVHAKPGASSAEILALLPPEIPPARLALVFVGVNNIISWRKWRTNDLADDLAAILDRLSGAERIAVMLPPKSLGKTFAPFPYGPLRKHRISKARAIIRQVAGRCGALVIDSPKLSGDRIWIDGVHPTSTGHLAMADATLATLNEAARASQLEYRQPTIRPDFKRWRAQAAVKFILTQPVHGIGTWLLGR